MLQFLVFALDAEHHAYDIIVHEITELHPTNMVSHFLPSYSTAVIRLSPWDLGWPVNRPRKFTIAVHKRLQFAGSQAEFLQIVSQRVNIPQAGLWLATPEEVEQAFLEEAARKSSIPLPGAERASGRADDGSTDQPLAD